MRYRLVHTDHLGHVHTAEGDPRMSHSTAQKNSLFETRDEARLHAREYVELHPMLECDIASVDGSFREIVKDEEAQLGFLRQYEHGATRGDRFLNVFLPTLFFSSLIANVVLGVLLYFK